MPSKPPSHRPPDRRPSAHARGYDRRWRRFRRIILRERPLCEDCGAPATEVDHRVAINRGGEKYDRANLRALCKPCHSRKTVAHDGGFGHAPQQ